MNTTEYTRNEIATIMAKNVEDVAILRGASYSTHITINGRAFCGRIDNDGYNLDTEFETFTSRGCGACRNYLNRRIAKVGA